MFIIKDGSNYHGGVCIVGTTSFSSKIFNLAEQKVASGKQSVRAACPEDQLEFIFSEPCSVLYLVLACDIKCRFAFLIIQGRNAYSESSRKRKLSEGEKGVRNWSWPLTKM